MDTHGFRGERMCGNDSTENIKLRNCVIGSMDVKALYPSIDRDFAVKKYMELIVNKKSTLETV